MASTELYSQELIPASFLQDVVPATIRTMFACKPIAVLAVLQMSFRKQMSGVTSGTYLAYDSGRDWTGFEVMSCYVLPIKSLGLFVNDINVDHDRCM